MKHSAPVVEEDVVPKRWRLSKEGRRQSAALAERLRRYRPRVVVSSEEPKAAETAEIVAGRLGIGCFVRPGLHEHDRTGAPFLSDKDFCRTVGTFFERPGKPAWGNETAEEAATRFEDAVRAVLDEWKEETVAVVAHGTVNALLVARHNGLDAHELWKELGLPSFCVLSPGFRLGEVVGRVV